MFEDEYGTLITECPFHTRWTHRCVQCDHVRSTLRALRRISFAVRDDGHHEARKDGHKWVVSDSFISSFGSILTGNDNFGE